MDLLQLQYFRAIAACGTMSQAAKSLFVSQPNLSTSLSRLEDDLGVQLFDRRRGKISLTETGRLFLDYVSQSLDVLDEGIAAIRLRENIRDSSIRLVSSQPDIIADVLRLCYPRNSNIQVKEMTCSNEDVFDLVMNKSVDFGLFYGDPKSNALEYNVVATSDRILALRWDHPLAGRGSVSLEELKNEKFICDHYRDDAALLASLPETVGFHPNICFECDNMQMESALISMSGGVSVLPAVALQKMLRDQPDLPVTGVRIEDDLPCARLGVVRHRGARLSPASLEFLRQMTDLFIRDNHRAAVMVNEMGRSPEQTPPPPEEP